MVVKQVYNWANTPSESVGVGRFKLLVRFGSLRALGWQPRFANLLEVCHYKKALPFFWRVPLPCIFSALKRNFIGSNIHKIINIFWGGKHKIVVLHTLYFIGFPPPPKKCFVQCTPS